MLLAFPFFLWLANSYNPGRGLFAAATAGAVCWVAGILALMATGVSAKLGSHAALSGVLLSMMLRMGIPFAAGMFLSQQPAYTDTGLFGLIVGYYLFALVVELPLSVMLNATAHGSQKPAVDIKSANNELTGVS